MRIIDTRRDYYDSIQGFGQDRTLVYVRKEEDTEYHDKRWPFPEWVWYSRSVRAYDIDVYVIGFCGKIYPLIDLGCYHTDDKRMLCYTLEEFDGHVEQKCKPDAVKLYYHTKDCYGGDVPGRKQVKKFFDECRQKQEAFLSMFESRRCPIFVALLNRRRHNKYQITYNDLLRPLEFYRVFDTYMAYQELAMFLGNMAWPNRPIPDVSDADLLAAKGFDKYSFRKDKQTK